MTARDLVAATKAAHGGRRQRRAGRAALSRRGPALAGSGAPARRGLDRGRRAPARGRAARPAARRRRPLVGRQGGLPHGRGDRRRRRCCAWPSRCIRRAARRRPASPSSTPCPCRRSWSRAPRTRSACRPPARRARVVTRPRQPRLTGDLEALRDGRARLVGATCSACQTEPMAIRMRDAMSGAARRAALRADREARARAPRRARRWSTAPARSWSGSPSAWCRPTRWPSRTCAASSCPRRRPARRTRGSPRSCTRASPSPSTPREGEAFDLRTAQAMREGVAFAPADPDLAGHVILDHHGFDAWYEEDEPIFGHPRDPFHRVDMRRSSRHVRVERNGELLAESSRAILLFETGLPTRFYLPREDVVLDLQPSARQTYCPYKGQASYWSVEWRASAPGPGLELRGPAAGRRAGDRPRRLLRRARRRRARRRAAGAAPHARCRRRSWTRPGSAGE